MDSQRAMVTKLRNNITDQIFIAFGFGENGWARRWLWPIFYPPAYQFSKLAASVDQDVAQYGFREAARRLLNHFVKGVEACGVEHIPPEGPVLLTSNHPGTYDSVAIAASVTRPDLKIVATGIPFLRELPHLRECLIYAPRDLQGRMQTLRKSLRHLMDGGALLIFPTGRIDPDPSFLPGASEALEGWSPSVELFLRKVPKTRLIVTIVSGVLAPACMRNPLVHLRKLDWEQRRVAEFIQVMQQLFIPYSFNLRPRVTFGDPVPAEELLQPSVGASLPFRQDWGEKNIALQAIIQKARQLLAEHCTQFTYRPARWL
jgi:1-acyl-sn-glycerol-3-phosphate acyltransferase